ncbi:MAG: phosphoenolpyruvate synthase [Deltaproteobacteria bacterium]|nr:MAG: phosphoenolpyruvate synthase [Deltaproteobacteria bacterium]
MSTDGNYSRRLNRWLNSRHNSGVNSGLKPAVLKLFRRKKSSKDTFSPDTLSNLFRFKYSCFKMLLDSNAKFLTVISDIEERLQGQEIFGMSYVRSRSDQAVFHTLRMVKNLDDLSGHRYTLLFDILEEINLKIKEVLGKRKEIPPTELILPYLQINAEMVDWVGGKNANLGEIHNRVYLPIPRGFAITTRAFESFMVRNELFDEISKKKVGIDPNNPETINTISEDIRQLITSAQVPAELEDAILLAYAKLAEDSGMRVSMRSSATGEDSELSYAGQYLSKLNVPSDQIIHAYKEIVASLYSPRAIAYRLNKGIRDEDVAMSVACLEMVESAASGVMYSRNPLNLLEENTIITAVWGLGPYAVDGVITPDSYTVGKNRQTIAAEISHKTVKLVSKPDEDLIEVPVADELQDKPCLSQEEIDILVTYALKLEEHYGCPQDIEWALDKKKRLFILQSRPLRVEDYGKGYPITPVLTAYPLLIEKGGTASAGVGFGPAFHVASDQDLLNFPDGAVLVARHSSPKFVMVMKKTRAIITDMGNIAGHMASLAREFAVPAIVNAKVATATIPAGMEVTVDAYSGRVYQGIVPELESFQNACECPMKDTPVYRVLREVSDWIIPLHLLDPKSPNFTPSFCRSLHDISRMVHEFSYTEMFQLSDFVSDKKGVAFKLKVSVPLDLYVIDLGGGMTETNVHLKSVPPDKIASIPFNALLRGIMHEDFQKSQLRPVEFKGFLSVMREQMLSPPSKAERFGDRSYAIISDKYLNFSSRVGYHYSILDSYCSQTPSMNYITFSFKGGAADDIRRNRRVRAIAIILQSLDFTVEVTGDRVDARYQKHEISLIEDKLDMIGRLLQFTRQMDMLMNNEASVEALAKNFLAGNYNLKSTVTTRESEVRG